MRLDKVANASITWETKFFREMLDTRIRFFSAGKKDFASLFSSAEIVEDAFNDIVAMAMGSPRELVKIMDIIIREHDVEYADEESILLGRRSVDVGLDTYAKDVVNTVFKGKDIGQIYRLKKSKFINKDVQAAPKVGDQSARARIKSWEDWGLAKVIGTRAAEGELGGKPANEYSITDARVIRIISRELVRIEDEEESSMPV